MQANEKSFPSFILDPETGYFRRGGVEVMAFDDFYPEGHQSGVSVIMHGRRIAANGDLRFEPAPGQWQPVPKKTGRTQDPSDNSITAAMIYPDPDRHLTGFNPMIYPDFRFSYTVTTTGEGESVTVDAQTDRPVPPEYLGKLSFNLELFPGVLFGMSWIMDEKTGVFPRQPNGPVEARDPLYPLRIREPLRDGVLTVDPDRLSGQGTGYNPMTADELTAVPYAAGHRFTLCPEDPLIRMTVVSEDAELRLYDGRMNHNNGWFVLSSPLPASGKLRWIITPHAEESWIHPPVLQISQVGYHPDQPKIAVCELDRRDTETGEAVLCRIGESGEEEAAVLGGTEWGRFLRSRYVLFDFSDVKTEGLYRLRCGGSETPVFRIARDVYDRGVWQPVLEYFLPVQMCHMRVSEKYRVWHGLCHNDDARMAPVNYNHIDGYAQGPSTLTKYAPGDPVPGLNRGGWHDAGDFDLRVESQAGEAYILALTYEAFRVDYDATAIDEEKKNVEIHQPDGKNDILQQIAHGLLTVVGGYKALGRLYRGIICSDLRQYVLLGDASTMTDGEAGNGDDRWVFTEDNPARELTTAAELAACARVMRGFDDAMADDALRVAEELYEKTDASRAVTAKLHVAAELYLTTGGELYRSFLLEQTETVCRNIGSLGWIMARALPAIGDETFSAAVREALVPVAEDVKRRSAETPYGIPYRPHIWGAGWDIQSQAFRHYFLYRAFPELFGPELLCNALNFILGCHPGENTASFASGVGAVSATTAYGANRADWSYIPGGVVSGTALIRPDLPELLEFPFLWQQTEYVMGGGSSHYMFLVLAVRSLFED